MAEASARSKYVPPHLRSRPSHPVPSTSRDPVPESYPEPYAQPSRGPWSSRPAPSDPSTSRTPWSVNKPRPSSGSGYDRPPGRRPISPPHNGPEYNLRPDSASARPPTGLDRNSRPRSDRGHARSGSAATSPTLHVFGDSFVGPFKLLSDDNVRFQTFKGASAKGLNNPNSLKQVSKDLVPLLNNLLAPPPYAYFPSTGRWVLLIFGNVDLQINYLWQLQNKPITPYTFSNASSASTSDRSDEMDEEGPGSNAASTSRDVLANATETSMRGSALGPELFVQTVAKAYTSWLEREIVNGPVGERLRQSEGETGMVRRKGPSKVLIAAALPPLVEDEILPRIPEKYVERLEEDHVKAHKAMGRRSSAKPTGREDALGGSSRTPWSRVKDEGEVLDGLSTLQVSDDTHLDVPRGRIRDDGRTDASSARSSSTASTARSSLFDPSTPMNGSVHTSLTIPSSPPTTDKETASTSGHTEDTSPTSILDSEQQRGKKMSIQQLLRHDPPLCTLPVRIKMTNTFNALISSFCGKYPEAFEYIDITPAILAGNYTPSEIGAADRSTWACPVDATNIHPLWEPTLPLWLDELKKVGVPTDSYRITEDAEETFRAYEADKRERTARQPWGKDGKKEEKEVAVERRIKIRDE